MQHRRRFQLLLEELEDRYCPSLTASFLSGSLYLTGSPIAAGSAQLLDITRTIGTSYQVLDAGHNLGTYNITGNLYLNLTRFASDININMNGGATPATAGVFLGNIYLNLGIGNTDFSGGFLNLHSVSILGGSAAGDLGVVNGTVYFLKGDGQETFNIGTLGNDQTQSAPVTVKGSISAVGSTPSGFFGNTLFINAGSVVRGNVTATLINELTINSFSGTGATVNGSLTVTDTTSSIGAFVDIIGSVMGNVNVSGTNIGDFVAVDAPLVGPAGFVGGNMAVSLGTGANIVDMLPGTTVVGNLTIVAGGGNNSIGGPIDGFNGTVVGNMAVTLGSGDNTINLTTNSTVFGSLTLNVGNGADSITASGTLFSTLRMTLGNGNDTVSVTGPPAGIFYLTAGNGDDSIFLSASTAGLFNVNFRVGTGSDTLTLDPANIGSITGSVISQLPGGNEFDQNGWTIVPPWTLIF